MGRLSGVGGWVWALSSPGGLRHGPAGGLMNFFLNFGFFLAILGGFGMGERMARVCEPSLRVSVLCGWVFKKIGWDGLGQEKVPPRGSPNESMVRAVPCLRCSGAVALRICTHVSSAIVCKCRPCINTTLMCSLLIKLLQVTSFQLGKISIPNFPHFFPAISLLSSQSALT